MSVTTDMLRWSDNGGVGVHREYFLRQGEHYIGGVSMNHRRSGGWNIYLRVDGYPCDTWLYVARDRNFGAVAVGGRKTADEARARLIELAGTPEWDRLRDERHGQLRKDERARSIHTAAGKLNAQQIQRIARLVRQQNDPEWDDIKAALEGV